MAEILLPGIESFQEQSIQGRKEILSLQTGLSVQDRFEIVEGPPEKAAEAAGKLHDRGVNTGSHDVEDDVVGIDRVLLRERLADEDRLGDEEVGEVVGVVGAIQQRVEMTVALVGFVTGEEGFGLGERRHRAQDAQL